MYWQSRDGRDSRHGRRGTDGAGSLVGSVRAPCLSGYDSIARFYTRLVLEGADFIDKLSPLDQVN